MSAAFWLVLIPTLCYAGTAVFYAMSGERPLAITYSGYAWANCGLLWLEYLRAK